MTWVTVVTAVVLQTIAFTNVAQGTSSQVDEPRKVIVRSAENPGPLENPLHSPVTQSRFLQVDRRRRIPGNAADRRLHGGDSGCPSN